MHFYTENELIRTGEKDGILLNLRTLGIGNGIIDAALQFPMVSRWCTSQGSDADRHLVSQFHRE